MSKEEKISAKFHSLLQFFVAEKQTKLKKRLCISVNKMNFMKND